MIKGYTIIVDTRERLPLWERNIKKEKLDVGDYSIDGYQDKIAIERKSLADTYSTLTGGMKRFKRELERAQSYDYFAIVIDGSYVSLLEKNWDGARYTKLRGFIVTATLFTLHVKYGINIFFSNGREESRKIIKEIFKAYLKNGKSTRNSKVSE